MQISHVVSDLVLAFLSLYVFFKYLAKLELTSTILWESFVLSVAGSALFGAIAFAGYPNARPISTFFQHLASINGALGLVVATYSLIKGDQLTKLTCYIILTLGFSLFAISEGINVPQINVYTPILAMVIILLLGIWAVLIGKSRIGIWIIFGVSFFAAANFIGVIITESTQRIDAFHYLNAAGILSLGMAVGQRYFYEKGILGK